MRTNKALWGLIIVTAGTFSVANVFTQQYLVAGLSSAIGVGWLILEVRQRNPLNLLFLLFFLGLAVLGSLGRIPAPFTLFGLSTDLAAWDLSRFQARLGAEEDSEAKTLLETKHLQRLAAVISSGFLIALLPTFTNISLGFVAVFFIVLLTLLTLRQSLLYLRDASQSDAERTGSR